MMPEKSDSRRPRYSRIAVISPAFSMRSNSTIGHIRRIPLPRINHCGTMTFTDICSEPFAKLAEEQSTISNGGFITAFWVRYCRWSKPEETRRHHRSRLGKAGTPMASQWRPSPIAQNPFAITPLRGTPTVDHLSHEWTRSVHEVP